ncbi:hypothetical protein BDV95DRAFT_671941 [Massariosphaeria phaeospora]|uniref:Uncharacterized protein n=1 Tax=Massariosphaeria phaeospora TaxID=100035 RepID=A0A7C8M865_9PLEO|nr:hypothetical protein BDV95DRAFT_671941 [Massariosphaeria phaeospora]
MSKPSPTTTPSLKDKYELSIPKGPKIRGIFTAQRPAYFLVDLLWVALMFVAALVQAGSQVQTRRSTFHLSISNIVDGSDEKLDFNILSAEFIVKWLSENPDLVQKSIDAENKRINYLGPLFDKLPKSFANPSRSTCLVSLFICLYFLYRFAFLHRQWRYNWVTIFVPYLVFLFCAAKDSIDMSLAWHISLFWCYPALVGVSILLHRLLGARAWRPLMVMLDVKPMHMKEEGPSADAERELSEELGQGKASMMWW